MSKFCTSFLGGTTLHAAFDFKFGNKYLNLTPQKLQQLQEIFKNVQLVIIDEFSMVGVEMLYNIHKRIQEFVIENKKDLFGGRAMMLVGDILQLPPVQASPIYAKPRGTQNKVLWLSPDNLWNSFEVVVLSKNFR